jgi:hypothetical protein
VTIADRPTEDEPARPAGGRWRRWAARVLLVLGALLAALGVVAGHVNRNVLDGPTFVDHVDELRRDDDVARQVGIRISDQLIAANPDLVALRPLVESVSIRVAGGDALSGPVRRAATIVHTALTEDHRDSVQLQISDIGAVVTGVLGAVAPDRAPAASDVSVTLATIGQGDITSTTVRLTHLVGVLSWLLPLLALVCLGGAVCASPDRLSTAVTAGWALLWAATGLGIVLAVVAVIVRRLDTDTLGGAVGAATWQQFGRPMRGPVVVLGLIGVGIAVTFGSGVPGALRARLVSIRRVVTRRPVSVAGTVGRAVVIGAIGVAAVLDPSWMALFLVVLAGLGAVLYAVSEIAELAEAARRRRAAQEPAAGTEPSAVAARGRRLRPPALLAAGALVVIAVLGVVVLARPGRDVDADAAAPAPSGLCNGHVELCDRRFDEVAYVASHNSMSVARLPGWFIPEQLDPIPEQLDQGVRALLIDVWSGRQAGSVVRTSPSGYAEAIAVTTEELGPDVAAAAGRIADSVAGVPEGPEARFLCHGACETGSTPFLETMIDVRTWLEAHPDEVLTLFIEDHVDAPLIAADIEAAGLAPFVYEPIAGTPFPTLGEMIASGHRLVTMVEEGDGGPDAPWLVNGFELTQDTPYTFPTVASFSCATNRGPADAPLFLLNHWLSGFSNLVSDAQTVNTRDLLLARAEQCQQERGQIPNFVAVNYVAFGDVYAVVDALNGVG